MAVRHLDLVRQIALALKRRLPDCVDVADLEQSGVFGLFQAAEKFNPARGVKFTTYATPRVRGAMLDGVRDLDWVPRLVRSRSGRISAAASALKAKLGRDARDDELAKSLRVSPSTLALMSKDAHAVELVSINRKWFETDSGRDVREIDMLEDPHGEDGPEEFDRMESLRRRLRSLPRAYRLLVTLYYVQEMTMKQIGRALGLSESRISQMHDAALQILRSEATSTS